MPLSPSTPSRKRLHTRRVVYEGFQRDDGLFDIEAWLLDSKDADLTLLSGVRPAGEPVHDMKVRVTIDRDFTIREIEAHTDRMPYPGDCDRIHPGYEQLVGANLVRGFRKRLHDTMGGVRGCTHITELLGYLPTAAVQTFAGLRKREDEGTHKPFQLDRCHALDTTGDAVRRYYPKWYRGAKQCHPERSEGPDSNCHPERSEGPAFNCHPERSEGPALEVSDATAGPSSLRSSG